MDGNSCSTCRPCMARCKASHRVAMIYFFLSHLARFVKRKHVVAPLLHGMACPCSSALDSLHAALCCQGWDVPEAGGGGRGHGQQHLPHLAAMCGHVLSQAPGFQGLILLAIGIAICASHILKGGKATDEQQQNLPCRQQELSMPLQCASPWFCRA
jgi:hypothetical protein